MVINSWRSRIRFVEDHDWHPFAPGLDMIGHSCDLNALQDAEPEWPRAEASAEPNDDSSHPNSPMNFRRLDVRTEGVDRRLARQ
jgi:hypothetical protein